MKTVFLVSFLLTSALVQAQTIEPLPLSKARSATPLPKTSLIAGNHLVSLTPFQFSIGPGIGTNPAYGKTINDYSLNLSVADDFKTRKAQLSLISGYVKENSTGIQLSTLSSEAGNSFTGIQSSLIYNSTEGTLHGIQASAGLNDALIMNGWQLGAVNSAVIGDGGQTGLVNVSDSSIGFQMGFINIASVAEKGQVGLVNMAETNDGVAIGLINYSKNGRNNLETIRTESGIQQFQYRTGSERFQLVYHLGFNGALENKPVIVGAGVSFRKPFSWVDIGYELSASKVSFKQFWDSDLRFLVKNQLITEFKVTDWLRLSGGVTFNAYGDANRTGERVTSGTDYQDKVNNAWYRFGFGYVAGISLF